MHGAGRPTQRGHMGSALQHKPAGYDMILDIIVRLRVWTAWREQLCVRGALREQHRGGRCVASPSVVSPIFSGAVPSLPRTLPGVMHGRACNLLWTPAGSVLASCWKGMWTGVGGFGPRSRHGWMEELSTGFKEKGRATEDRASVARYDIGYGWLSALCGGRSHP